MSHREEGSWGKREDGHRKFHLQNHIISTNTIVGRAAGSSRRHCAASMAASAATRPATARATTAATAAAREEEDNIKMPQKVRRRSPWEPYVTVTERTSTTSLRVGITLHPILLPRPLLPRHFMNHSVYQPLQHHQPCPQQHPTSLSPRKRVGACRKPGEVEDSIGVFSRAAKGRDLAGTLRRGGEGRWTWYCALALPLPVVFGHEKLDNVDKNHVEIRLLDD
ncbi:hypothetical protein DFH27DRAFT_617136 [Peziza echinospora]|nr:hypothetical protein DFH27DRAFT_617136 [Peziza echinospora]